MTDPTLDFRSDTGTRPSPAMRAAMAAAEVGDDVYGDDPTVNALQQRCADLLGKQAGLFVPSGSMGNLVGLAAHCGIGQEVLCDPDAHVLNHEGGGIALLPVSVRALPAEAGVLPEDVLAAAIRPGDDHGPRTAAVVVEITHTFLGGTVPDFAAVQALTEICREAGVAVHLDGARLFNAVVAGGRSAAEWAAGADTVTFCFSKGLGAPVGSMVVGSAPVIERARRWRKRLGGSMRQAGVLAAAADVALTEGVPLLAIDHRRAAELAAALAAALPGSIDPDTVHTNIVHLDCTAIGLSAPVLAAALADRGLLTKSYDRRVLRLVTHRDLADDSVPRAVDLILRTVSGLRETA